MFNAEISMNRATRVSAEAFLLVLLVGCGSTNPPSEPSTASISGVQPSSESSTTAPNASQVSEDEAVNASSSGLGLAESSGSEHGTDGEVPLVPPQQWEPQTDWEKTLMSEVLSDVRGGVKLYGDEAFGLCRKGENNQCGEYLGPTPGTLEAGEYFVFAQVQAPSVADGWKVVYTSNCGLTSGGGTSVRPEAKERIYPVKYKTRRAYPVRMPSVVSPGGATESKCEISLDSLGPGGERQRIGEGQFTVPAR